MSYRYSALVTFALLISANAWGQQSPGQARVVPSPQSLLAEAAEDGRYVFLLFYKQSDEATKAMRTTLQEALAGEEDRALGVPVQVTNPANGILVTKYDVARAPMPMVIAVAPNGAVTGLFANKLSSENVQESFVTPTMMSAMKSLQEGKLVFVAVQGSIKTPSPVALQDFKTDAHFKDRMTTLTMRAADPAEAKFLSQVKIDATTKVTKTVLLAPPGVLVGSFDASATKDEIAGALAAAGKCCDDPNCKHHQAAPTRTASPAPPAARKK